MRGYLENLEREHRNHEDNCGCEIDLAENPRPPRPSFEQWMAEMEAIEAARDSVICTFPDLECDCWRCEDSRPHGGSDDYGNTCECNHCGEWYSRQSEIEKLLESRTYEVES